LLTARPVVNGLSCVASNLLQSHTMTTMLGGVMAGCQTYNQKVVDSTPTQTAIKQLILKQVTVYR